MTTDQKRILIAEVCLDAYLAKEGLKPHQRTDDSILYGGHPAKGLWIYANGHHVFGVNCDSAEQLRECEAGRFAERYDDFETLDGCHAFEKLMDSEQCDRFNTVLMDLKKPRTEVACTAERWSWHSDADQRVEAFGIVMGLWKEGE